MKHLKGEAGVALIAELLLVAVVLALVGVAVYAALNQKASPVVVKSQATVTLSPTTEPTASPTPLVAPPPGSDIAMIWTTASNQCNSSGNTNYGASLDGTPKIVGDSAQVGVHCTGYISGHVDYLKKANGSWSIVATGQQPPSKAICAKYTMPASWCQAD
jgi:hypothetical protein